MQINGQRLLDDLKTLAGFGKAGTGVNRLTYSRADRLARHWLAERMTDAGLERSSES